MLKLVAGEAVQWRDGERHCVGRVLCGSISKRPIIIDFACRLLRIEPSGEVAVVATERLSPYPSSPIPDPNPVNVGPVS